MKKDLKYFESEIKRITEEFEDYKKKHMGTPKPGEVVEISGMEWMILDKLPDGYFAILNSFYGKTRMFDSDSSNWKESSLREELNTSFLEKINTPFDGNAVVEFDRNLLALDGQTEYGTCRDKISLLTVDEYRKYRKYLPNMDKWWWLITPWSTPYNDYFKSVAVVSSSGGVYYGDCYYDCGVRPACIFSSSIFESDED